MVSERRMRQGRGNTLLKSNAAGPGCDQLLTLVSGPEKLWAFFSISGMFMPLVVMLEDVLKRWIGNGAVLCFRATREALVIEVDFGRDVETLANIYNRKTSNKKGNLVQEGGDEALLVNLPHIRGVNALYTPLHPKNSPATSTSSCCLLSSLLRLLLINLLAPTRHLPSSSYNTPVLRSSSHFPSSTCHYSTTHFTLNLS